MVGNLVLERQEKLKQSMTIMGLKNYVYWARYVVCKRPSVHAPLSFTLVFFFLSFHSWFVTNLAVLLVSSAVITAMLIGFKVLRLSQWSIVFVFLLDFSLATISFCFFLSVLFNRASTGTTVAGVAWFLSFVPYFFVIPRYEMLSDGAKLALATIPGTGLALGANLISIQENNGLGITWSNVDAFVNTNDEFTFRSVLVMLFIDAVAYFILAWWINQVFPGDFGIHQVLVSFAFGCVSRIFSL